MWQPPQELQKILKFLDTTHVIWCVLLVLDNIEEEIKYILHFFH